MWSDALYGVLETLVSIALVGMSVLSLRAFTNIDTSHKLRMFQMLCVTEMISMGALMAWTFYCLVAAPYYYASLFFLFLFEGCYITGAFLSHFGSRKTNRKLILIGQITLASFVVLFFILSLIDLIVVYLDAWMVIALILLVFGLAFSVTMGTLVARQLQLLAPNKRLYNSDGMVDESMPHNPAAYYVTGPQSQIRGDAGYGTLAEDIIPTTTGLGSLPTPAFPPAEPSAPLSAPVDVAPADASRAVRAAAAPVGSGTGMAPSTGADGAEQIPTFPSSFKTPFRGEGDDLGASAEGAGEETERLL